MLKHKLKCEDCIAMMREMMACTIDLTVTSPPYDNLRTYEGSLEWGEHIWKPVLEELYRITKDGGVVVWIVGDATVKGSESGTSFRQALWAMECGFNLHDTMIWEKPNPVPQFINQRYRNNFEYMFVLSKGKVATFNYLTEKTKHDKEKTVTKSVRKRTKGNDRHTREYTEKLYRIRHNVWSVAVGGSSGHTAAFPEQLASDHIISWSNEGDTVLDPFMGSGTTGKMALELGRNFIGVEKVEKYFDIAKKRIEESHGGLF